MQKMTDEQVMYALALCSSEHLGCEDGCPYTMQACMGGDSVMKDAIALINSQKEEIDIQDVRIMNLKHEVERLNESCNSLISANTLLISRIDKVKTEAIKEFAEGLKATVDESALQNGDVHFVALYKAIDEVAKELTE